MRGGPNERSEWGPNESVRMVHSGCVLAGPNEVRMGSEHHSDGCRSVRGPYGSILFVVHSPLAILFAHPSLLVDQQDTLHF